MAKAFQPSFAFGEVTPDLYARTDTAVYAQGLRTCRNWYVRRTGGVSNRPGTKYVAEVKTSANATRVIPFRFSRTTSYVLEFGSGYVRFYKNGVQITSGGVPYQVTAPYTTADLPDIRFTQSADVMTLVHPSYTPYELRRTSDTNWTLAAASLANGPFKDVNTDDGIYVWATATTGTVTLYASGDLFTADMEGMLFYLEASLTDISPWEPDKQIAAPGNSPFGEIRRNSVGDVYRCTTTTTAGANEIRTGTVEPTHKTGTVRDGDGSPITNTSEPADVGGVAWEYLYSFYGILSINTYTSATQVTADVVGRLPSSVVNASTLTTLATIDGDDSTTTFSVAGATSDDSEDYIVTEHIYINKPSGPVVDDTRVLSPDEYSVTGTTTDEITFDVAPSSFATVTVQSFGSANRTNVWALGAWSDASGYPSTVTYFGDRLTFANTTDQPQTVWASKTGDYPNFGVSFPSAPDDAITFTLNARQVNPITDLVPLTNLVMLTDAAEWRMTTGDSELVTPSTIGARVQTENGSAGVAPEIVGNSIIYVESSGDSIRGMGYEAEAGGYTDDELSYTASHLFEDHSISRLAFHRRPYRMLWLIRDDGTLLSLTYLREQQVVGWAQHTTGNGDTFEDVCVVPEDGQDYAYFVVNRTVGGSTVRYIERLQARKDTQATIDDWWYLDSAVQYNGENSDTGDTMTLSGSGWTVDDFLTLTATGHTPFASSNVGDEVLLESGSDSVVARITGYTSSTVVTILPQSDVPASLQATAVSTWTFRKRVVTGLTHLNGRTVNALVDGNVEEDLTVSSGQVTLTNPGGHVVVGLPIENADIETLSVGFANAETQADRRKSIPKVSAYVRNTRGIKAGRDSSADLYEVQAREDDDDYGTPSLRNEVSEFPIGCSWEKDGRVLFRQKYPLPATILGIVPTVEMGGTGSA